MPSKRVADNGMFCPPVRRAFQRDFELLTCWVAKIGAETTVEGASMKRRIMLLPITLGLTSLFESGAYRSATPALFRLRRTRYTTATASNPAIKPTSNRR
jgi:hypothetical protein